MIYVGGILGLFHNGALGGTIWLLSLLSLWL